MNTETKQKIVDALRGSQIGAVVACALGVETTGPRFTSKAIVTSDGFVQANFVDRDEIMRHSAFVGSLDELQVNMAHVVVFLQKAIPEITDEDTDELTDKVLNDWIAVDYRARRA